jgi:threonine synthase
LSAIPDGGRPQGMTHLACIAGCDGQHDPFQPLFQCPACGGLVDVVHDLAPLKATSADGWKRTLAARASSADAVDQSGVWAHREWIMPELDPADIVTAGEGRSPLVDVPRLADAFGVGRLSVKQCGQTLTGSFKDLGMTVLVSMASAMHKRGVPLRALVCASTGDTSAALAAYGAMAGLPVIVLLPRGKISLAQLVQPMAHGARVLALDTDFDGCMAIVQALSTREGIFLANSKNPLRIEGQKTVAFEIAAQRGFKVPDVVVVPSGNLGNVSALHAGFSLLLALGLTDRLPRLVAAQVDAANPLFRAFEGGLDALTPITAAATHASAIRIGNPVSWPRAQKALKATDGWVTTCSEAELLGASALADRAGLFVCPHTAAALAGVRGLGSAGAGKGWITREDEVVVVSTAHGLKFSEQKVAFHEGEAYEGERVVGDVALPADVAHLRNPPVVLDATLDAVLGAIDNGAPS